MAEIIWTTPALSQLDAIADFIASENPGAAKAVVRRVFAAGDDLKRFLHLGRPVPEIPHPAYRQIWVKPCWIYYRVGQRKIYILHVRRAGRPLRIDDLLHDD
jgi:plasmid stabilization system protein ParE